MFRTIMAVVVIITLRNKGERDCRAHLLWNSMDCCTSFGLSFNTPKTFSNYFVVNGNFLKTKYICYNRKFIESIDSCKDYKRNSCPPII